MAIRSQLGFILLKAAAHLPEANEPLLLGKIIYSALFLITVYGLQALDLWHRFFAVRTPLNLAYHSFRLSLFFYLAWLMFYTGKLLFSRVARRLPGLTTGRLHYFVSASFFGAAAITLAMFLLGVLRLYYLHLLLFITLPLIFWSFPEFIRSLKQLIDAFKSFLAENFRSAERRPVEKLLIGTLCAAVGGEVILIVLAVALYPDLLEHDGISQYLPYFIKTISQHGLIPNQYFLQYFYSKGEGLQFLAAILGDAPSIQLISTHLFLLSGLILYLIVGRLFPRQTLWPLLALFIYWSSPQVFKAEFQKPHVTVGAFVVFIVYMEIVAQKLKEPAYQRAAWLQFLNLSALTVISPVSCAFTIPFLMGCAVWRRRLGESRRPRRLWWSALGAGIVCGAMLTFNYLTIGLPEASPFQFFSRLANESIFNRYYDSALLCLQQAQDYQEGYLTPPSAAIKFDREKSIGLYPVLLHYVAHNFFYNSGDRLPRIPVVLFLLIFLALGIGGYRLVCFIHRKKAGGSLSTRQIIPPLFLALLVILLNLSLTDQTSAIRYFFFSTFFLIALYFAAMGSFIAIFSSRYSCPVKVLLLSLTLVYAAGNLNDLIKANQTRLSKTPFFLTGQLSYADLYAIWGVYPCLWSQAEIGERERILLFNYHPGCAGIPGEQFQFLLQAVYNDAIGGIMFGPPDLARQVLIRHGVNYFLVDLDSPLIYIAYSPLFAPENIPAHFKVYRRRGNTYILTWKDEKPTSENEREFVEAYRKRRAADQSDIWDDIYNIAAQKCGWLSTLGQGKEL